MFNHSLLSSKKELIGRQLLGVWDGTKKTIISVICSWELNVYLFLLASDIIGGEGV
jgi:hypothetical protein